MMATRSLQMTRSLPRAAAARGYAVRVQAIAKAGDSLPAATVWENDTKTSSKLTDIFKGKKGILVSVPGAFTPVCSSKHVPSYIENYDKLKAKGVEVIAIVSANDPYVMGAWGKQTGGVDKGLRFLADVKLEVGKGLGAEKDATEKLGSVRLERFSAIIDDNKITHFNLEDAEEGSSFAPKALEQLS